MAKRPLNAPIYSDTGDLWYVILQLMDKWETSSISNGFPVDAHIVDMGEGMGDTVVIPDRLWETDDPLSSIADYMEQQGYDVRESFTAFIPRANLPQYD